MPDKVPQPDPDLDAGQKADKVEESSGQQKADQAETDAPSDAEDVERNSGVVSE